MSQESVDYFSAQSSPVDEYVSVDIIVGSQQRLLTETLYSSWNGPEQGQTFLAAANVGLFNFARRPPVVPDVFLSINNEIPPSWWGKEQRSYFLWEFGPPPHIVIEIVSRPQAKVSEEKKKRYAWMRVPYYVIFDPLGYLMPEILTVYRYDEFGYQKQATATFPTLKLGLTLWEGKYEEKWATWLRWTDETGALLLCGKERAEHAEFLLDQERQRATILATRLNQWGQSVD